MFTSFLIYKSNQINLVLWGSRATEFNAQIIHYVGQESHVVAIFVGMLLKSYKG
jgi:replication factor A1